MKNLLPIILLSLALEASCPAGVVVVGSLARNKTVKPGETFEGVLLLKNSESSPADVRIYQSDYLFSADGSNLYDQPGSTRRSNADWIVLSPTRFTIPPSNTFSVYYKGKVPDNPELAGTYWSMVMVEPSVTPAPAIKGERDKIELGVQTLIRFGVQLVTEIADTGSRSIKILDKRLVSKSGKRTLELDAENTGERMLIPSLWVELYDDKGLSVGKFEGGRWRIYPACSVRYKVDLSDVPPGRYAALVVLDNGDEHVMGAQYELQLEN